MRRFLADEPVDIFEVLPEQKVERFVVAGAMVVAVPPEPVAAFGNEKLVPGTKKFFALFAKLL